MYSTTNAISENTELSENTSVTEESYAQTNYDNR